MTLLDTNILVSLGLAVLIMLGLMLGLMIWVNILNSRVPERPDPPSEETKGPFTRPSAPANPSVLDHSHMRSGTIYEISNPETEGILPVRTELSRSPSSRDPTFQYFNNIIQAFGGGRSMAEISNSIHESLNASQAASGAIVQITHTVIDEQEVLDPIVQPQSKQEPKPKEPEVIRKSRYQRDPVI